MSMTPDHNRRLSQWWDDSDPVSKECCTDGTCESCAPLFEWAEYRKDYEPNDALTAYKAFIAGFEGGLEYAWMREACDPTPVPEWRRLVGDSKTLWHDDPLPEVLQCLTELAYEPAGIQREFLLARIVAVCEAQVGDGWQANPLRCFIRQHSAWRLLNTFSRNGIDAPSITDWMNVADMASHWLCDLTEDGAE